MKTKELLVELSNLSAFQSFCQCGLARLLKVTQLPQNYQVSEGSVVQRSLTWNQKVLTQGPVSIIFDGEYMGRPE